MLDVAKRLAIAIDVAAFNDVAVYCRKQPRDVVEIRAALDFLDATIAPDAWADAHAVYVSAFDSYAQDADTLAWRDARQVALKRARVRG